ncbi:MAG: gfo/Idh/MocA family oxidoreductase [Spirochaetaceae bacterium]|nr:MAG: gfo/Idh/MocA family oxidoreductase [Spirochaetaceae bacterium]
MGDLRVGVIGTGFWARYQIAAWQQLDGVRVTAVTNRTRAKADALAADMGIPTVCATAEELVARDDVDVVDIITSETTHASHTILAASAGKHVICQKPMAESWPDCVAMVDATRRAGVRCFIHDNWRWQSPIRGFLEWYRDRPVGSIRRARLSYLSSFPVFDMQPALRDAKRFMLMDMGTHIIDTARSFVGDLRWVAASTATVTPGIAGEDVATVLAGTDNDAHATIELSYASPVEHEHELETRIVLECDDGVMELGPHFRASVTTRRGESTARYLRPVTHDWLIPRYTLSMGSCLPANRSFRDAIASGGRSENDAEDYLNTMEAVFAAYESARTTSIVRLETGGAQ